MLFMINCKFEVSSYIGNYDELNNINEFKNYNLDDFNNTLYNEFKIYFLKYKKLYNIYKYAFFYYDLFLLTNEFKYLYISYDILFLIYCLYVNEQTTQKIVLKSNNEINNESIMNLLNYIKISILSYMYYDDLNIIMTNKYEKNVIKNIFNNYQKLDKNNNIYDNLYNIKNKHVCNDYIYYENYKRFNNKNILKALEYMCNE